MMRLYKISLLIFVSFVLASQVVAAELRCDIQSKFWSSQTGCKENVLELWNLIDLEDGKFSRCDKKGCDHYQMVVTRSGIYPNPAVPGKGMLAKMAADGSEYLEVDTLGTTEPVSHGTCK